MTGYEQVLHVTLNTETENLVSRNYLIKMEY